MQDVVTPDRLGDVRHLRQADDETVGGAQWQVRDVLRIVAIGLVQNNGDIVRPIAFMNLSDHTALEGRLHGLHHLHRAQSPVGQLVQAQAHLQHRRAGRRAHLDVGRAVYATHHRRHRLRLPVELIQILAVDVHHHRRGITGDRLVHALA